MLSYLQTFWEQFNWATLLDTLQRLAGILLCLTVHETCHGLAAWLMGDATAKRQNRLSLNPLHHIDWLGLAAMFICGFGWAKPVQVDMRSFKNPRRGMALTALAGPVSNFLLALALLFGASLLAQVAVVGTFAAGVFYFMVDTAALSIGLGLFNLVPIPPLDGSKILFSLLPQRAYAVLMRYEHLGMLVLLVIVSLDLGGNYLSRGILLVFQWMAGLFF